MRRSKKFQLLKGWGRKKPHTTLSCALLFGSGVVACFAVVVVLPRLINHGAAYLYNRGGIPTRWEPTVIKRPSVHGGEHVNHGH